MAQETSKKRHICGYCTPFGPGEGPEMMRHHLESDLSAIVESEVTVPFVYSTSDLLSHIESEYESHGPLEGLVLAFHGARNKLLMSDGNDMFSPPDIISRSNAMSRLGSISDYFSDDARLILYACATGKKSIFGNIAETLHDVLGISVEAPKQILVSPDNDWEDWSSQLTLDEEGIIRFDYDNFAYYDRLKARWADQRGKRCCIAHKTYSSRRKNRVNTETDLSPDDLFLRL